MGLFWAACGAVDGVKLDRLWCRRCVDICLRPRADETYPIAACFALRPFFFYFILWFFVALLWELVEVLIFFSPGVIFIFPLQSPSSVPVFIFPPSVFCFPSNFCFSLSWFLVVLLCVVWLLQLFYFPSCGFYLGGFLVSVPLVSLLAFFLPCDMVSIFVLRLRK